MGNKGGEKRGEISCVLHCRHVAVKAQMKNMKTQSTCFETSCVFAAAELTGGAESDNHNIMICSLCFAIMVPPGSRRVLHCLLLGQKQNSNCQDLGMQCAVLHTSFP